MKSIILVRGGIMNFKNLIIFSLMVILLSLSYGCLKESTLKDKLIKANSNVNTYNLDMNASVDIETEILNQKQYLKIETKTDGKIDRNEKAMSMIGVIKIGVIKTNFSGFSQEADVRTYIKDDFQYVTNLGRWTKQRIDNDTWNKYDIIRQYTELINNRTIEYLKKESKKNFLMEMINRTPHYVIKVNPDLKKATEFALQQREKSIIDTERMNVTNYSAKIWINKKTFMMEKIKVDIELKMIPENIRENNISIPKREIKIILNTLITISNVNENTTIILPVEARYVSDVTYWAEFSKLPRDISKCQNITNQEEKDNCYLQVSKVLINVSICNEIVNQELKGECLQNIAATKENISICDEIDDSVKRDFCLSLANRFKRNISVCYKMTTKEYKDSCFAIAEDNDIKKCEMIENQQMRDNCFNYLAQRVQDASICDNIKEKYAREGCEITVRLKDNDETICEKYTDIDKDNCYIRLSIKLNSIDICGKISTHVGSDQCYRDIGINLQNSSVCELIVDDMYRDWCLINMKQKNEAICHKIKNQESKDICLNQIS